MRFLFLLLCFPWFAYSQLEKDKLPILEISKNQRYLQTKDSQPFFWLGDTAWLLFSKLSREEAEFYLDDRVKKGFNVVQVMVLHELGVQNYYGDLALINENLAMPNATPGDDWNDPKAYDYWDHVDFIVDLAESKGLYIAMVPVWGSNLKTGKVTLDNAVQYADWLSKRYGKKSNIIWLNGGDTKGNEHLKIWNAIGTTLKRNTPDKLVTFHPFGRMKSSTWFHGESWLDFNMFQSGHRRYDQEEPEWGHGQDSYKYVIEDLALLPKKPTIDGEPAYENIPQGLHDPSEPYWQTDDVRRYAYWSVFAGGFGFTYGHNAVMQMHKPGDTSPAFGVKEYWKEALDAKGSLQMQFLKKLILSKPFFERIPDQSLIAGDNGTQYDYQIATRGKDYAFIYVYKGQEIEVIMGKIEGAQVKASWYNPRNGESKEIGVYKNKGIQMFNPPGAVEDGNDWVLVLEKSR